MIVPHFSHRKSVSVAFGLSLLGLSVLGIVASGQEQDTPKKSGEALKVVQAVPQRAPEPPDEKESDEPEEKTEKAEKTDRPALRKEREALLKQRSELDRKLARISRSLGEPTISVFGNGRTFTYDSAPAIELQRKAIEQSKAAIEDQRRAVETMRRSMKDQGTIRADAMKRAMEELEKAKINLNGNSRIYRINPEEMAELKALKEMPKFEMRFNDKDFAFPKDMGGNKEFEANMRRFEQKMQAWQKQFEARMEAWQKRMEDRNERKP